MQYLSRAEAAFREIQVAFQQGGGGGGGGGGSQGRDLASLFDLEMDTSKNQYETPQRAQNGGPQQIRRWMKRCGACRSWRGASSSLPRSRRRIRISRVPRWEQEKLRREAEELAKKLEQLAKQSGSREMDNVRQRVEQAARDMQSGGGQTSSSSQQADRNRRNRAGSPDNSSSKRSSVPRNA